VPCTGAGCVTSCDIQQPCSATDCYTCASIPNCVWTAFSKVCTYSKVQCTDNTCASNPNQCSTASNCYGVTSCLACSRLSGCMWYGNQCFSVPCQGGQCATMGYMSQCPQPVCNQYSTCTTCLQEDGCLWSGVACLSTSAGPCTYSGCVSNTYQCPENSCVYGQTYSYSLRLCQATSCSAPNACPANYTCSVQAASQCGQAICPVVCTRPVPTCGVNEQWTWCASSNCFEPLCSDNYATRVCASDCRSGCQCMPGFARGPGNVCVSQSSCTGGR